MLLKGTHTLGRFSANLYKGDNFCDSVCSPAHQIPFEKESALKGKNLLPGGANSFLLE